MTSLLILLFWWLILLMASIMSVISGFLTTMLSPGKTGKSSSACMIPTISIKSNHYSVPDTLAGQSVTVQMYSEKVVIYDKDHKKVAVHERSYNTNDWIVDINHYINTLMKKTSAIAYSEAFHQMPNSMQQIYHKYFKDNGKEFLMLRKATKMRKWSILTR